MTSQPVAVSLVAPASVFPVSRPALPFDPPVVPTNLGIAMLAPKPLPFVPEAAVLRPGVPVTANPEGLEENMRILVRPGKSGALPFYPEGPAPQVVVDVPKPVVLQDSVTGRPIVQMASSGSVPVSDNTDGQGAAEGLLGTAKKFASSDFGKLALLALGVYAVKRFFFS
uniref:hypothetical protein n=1 Tax=Nitrospira cf. moscoviensis SBR1015 TaxID=96242 RepID=UPI00117D8555|nr:hypothetical protein [Nitrospira cf. moscoviensis SBR1015]